MSIGSTVADFFAALFIVAVIYVLVRPRSAAAEMVTNFSAALAALVRTATDI
jgi:hypothetical protein